MKICCCDSFSLHFHGKTNGQETSLKNLMIADEKNVLKILKTELVIVNFKILFSAAETTEKITPDWNNEEDDKVDG